MSGCLVVGAMILSLAGPNFTLNWQHSVEKIGWRESWRIEGAKLRLTEAGVKGSGAGMEPGPDAQLKGGWWVWMPDLGPLDSITLATSGATGGGWHLCDGDNCHDIPETGVPVLVRPCGGQEWQEGAQP